MRFSYWIRAEYFTVAKIIFLFCFVSKKVLQKCTVVYTAKEGNGVILSPILVNLALQKLIKSIKMVPSGIKIGKEQLNTSLSEK
jgi:hypothetical protein